MNINSNHWGLLVLNFVKTEVQILESLGMRDESLEQKLVSIDPLRTTYHLLSIELQLHQTSCVRCHVLGQLRLRHLRRAALCHQDQRVLHVHPSLHRGSNVPLFLYCIGFRSPIHIIGTYV